jgi:hypothetical protein
MKDIDDKVGHISRTFDLLFQLQLFIFGKIALQDGFLRRSHEELRLNVILPMVDEIKRILKLEGRGSTSYAEENSRMDDILREILDVSGDKFLNELFRIGTDNEICRILVKIDGEKVVRVTHVELKCSAFCMAKSIEIRVLHLSRVLRFYCLLFSKIRERSINGKDIARDLMIFLKHVSKVDMNVDDMCVFLRLVDIGYCVANNINLVEYSEFINTTDHSFLPEIRSAVVCAISNLNIQSIIEDEYLRGVINPFKYNGKICENVIQDFIKKISASGFYYVKQEINGFINQLRSVRGGEAEPFLIELISNNLLIYSHSGPCGCRKGNKGRCVSHFNKETIAGFVSCLAECLSKNTLKVTLKSYCSLLKLVEVDEGMFSKVEIFKGFPLKMFLSLISSSGELLSTFKVFKVVIGLFLESKECVRRLINNELLISGSGMDIDDKAAVNVWGSFVFRDMEIFMECIGNKKRSIIARKDRSGDVICRMVVEELIKCIGEDDGCGVLSVQVLTEIIFNHPSLSVLCEDRGFIENTIWKFIRFDDEEECVLGSRFINIIFMRTNNFKLKRMILDVIIQKMEIAGDSPLKSGFSLLSNLFNYKIHVEKYDFSEDLVCDRGNGNEHDCGGYCELGNIFRQNANILSGKRLFDLVFNEHWDYAFMSSDNVTGFAFSLKTLLLLHLRKVICPKGNGANIVNDETIQSYLNDLEREMRILSNEFCNSEPCRSCKREKIMSGGSTDIRTWGEMVKFWTISGLNLESSLSRWHTMGELTKGSIDLVCFIRSYMEKCRPCTNGAKDERIAFTMSMRGGGPSTSGDRLGRQLRPHDINRDDHVLTADYYFSMWIDKEEDEIIKKFWGNSLDHFQGILPPISPKVCVNIARLVYLSDGRVLRRLCKILAWFPFDRRVRYAFFRMVSSPLYKLGTCSQDGIGAFCKDASIGKASKIISQLIIANSCHMMYFLMDARLVYSIFLSQEVSASRDLINEMSSYKIRVDKIELDSGDGVNLNWMDDMPEEFITQYVDGFDTMIPRSNPIVKLLNCREKLWLKTIATFINEREFENLVAYLLRMICFSKVVPITVYAFIFFDILANKFR